MDAIVLARLKQAGLALVVLLLQLQLALKLVEMGSISEHTYAMMEI